MQRATVLISGLVQGVGFRFFARKKAQELGVSGYAENLSDGRVEVVIEGDIEDLEHFIHHLRQGPRGSKVDGVDVQWSSVTGLKGFQVY